MCPQLVDFVARTESPIVKLTQWQPTGPRRAWERLVMHALTVPNAFFIHVANPALRELGISEAHDDWTVDQLRQFGQAWTLDATKLVTEWTFGSLEWAHHSDAVDAVLEYFPNLESPPWIEVHVRANTLRRMYKTWGFLRELPPPAWIRVQDQKEASTVITETRRPMQIFNMGSNSEFFSSYARGLRCPGLPTA
jgi:hypothetical protein